MISQYLGRFIAYPLLVLFLAISLPVWAQSEKVEQRLGEIRSALAVQRLHTAGLMQSFDVVGTATALGADGKPEIRVFTVRPDVRGIPDRLDGVPVRAEVTGRFYALRGLTCDADGDNVCETSERWPLPVPIGVSVGHPAITAGTIGARVTDGSNVFILSNNHVIANVNQANINDPIWQPGAFDGGQSDDAIATLSDFEEINFCTVVFIWVICSETNTIDAAIALTTTAELGVSTPLGEYGSTAGYGVPSSVIHSAYGDPSQNADDDLAQLMGVGVRKFGRTTGETMGTIDGIAQIDVCYDSFCSLVARFTGQLVITPATFSGGGDSGSLIITDDGVRNPVGLLFAGSSTNTIANPIGPVLVRFSVNIDEGGGVAPVTDIAITDIGVPANPVVGETTDVSVTVRNVGNQNVTDNFEVVLTDQTQGGAEIGRQNVAGLATGASTVLTFPWTPVSGGQHTLRASHDFADDDNSNDAATTSVDVLDQPLTGPVLRFWQGFASTNAWQTVTLDQDYGNDMVVVCTPNYDQTGLGPTVVRVRNAAGTSFEVGLARPWFGSLAGEHWSANVHCMIVRAGVYTQAEHGVTMEAVRLANFISTDNSGGWSGESQAYANAYSTPVVVGQVIGATGAIPGEIGDWTVFWSRGSAVNRAPSSGALYVGRHTGEDPNGRPPETVAYIVIEQGSGTMDGIAYEAGLGGDTVRGIGNAPPYAYALGGIPSPSIGVLSQAGMDGVNGGWAILYGANALTAGQLNMAIEEDWYFDPERRHTTEQVSYIVFD